MRLPWLLTLTLLLICPLPCHAGGDAVLPAGVNAVWDLDKAWREKTPTRERVCLNGLWRWQPAAKKEASTIPTDNWGYLKVPGTWPGTNGGYMWLNSQTAYLAPAWKDTDFNKLDTAWHQREFTVPADWAGRRITVSMEYLYTGAVVFVDGKKMGEAYFPGGEVDITAGCQGNSKHLLTILASVEPLSAETTYLAGEGLGFKSKATVALRALCGDVFLNATPVAARIGDLKIETSVRRWELGVSAALPNLGPEVKYQLAAVITEKGKAVQKFVSPSFNAGDLHAGRFSFTSAWKPEKLWDLHTAGNMYELELSLLDEKGKVIDTLPPARFGFREFWIDGRDFMLNGTRIDFFAMPLESAGISAASASYEGARETLRRLKGAGVSLVFTHNYGCLPGTHLGFSEILRAADDEGMLVSFSMPHANDYDWKAEADASRAYARHAEFYVRAAQNHPSVVMYVMNHNQGGYDDMFNPDHTDGKRDPWGKIGPRTDRFAKLAERTEGLVRQFDNTRVIYHHSGGNIGQVFTMNIYLNHVPAQERDDWFAHWEAEGVKPLFLCEYGTPSDMDWTTFRGWYKGQRSWWNGKLPYELCLPEWGAQYRGDKAYDITEKEKRNLRWEANAWRTRVAAGWFRWDYPYNFPDYRFDVPNILDVLAMYVPDNWRSFRTRGVSFDTWEWERVWAPRPGFVPARKTFAVDWEHLQKPGFSADFLEKQFEQYEYAYETTDWVPTAAAAAMVRNSQPILGYIGGAAAHVTGKDHNFLAGSTVEKQIVVINNSRQTREFTCEWTFRLPQAIGGNATFTLETGKQKRVPISCALPAGLAPGAYEIAMTLRAGNDAPQTDTFALHVLQPAPGVKLTGKIALFDPAGETGHLLTRAHVQFTSVGANADLSGYDTLIIGKAALALGGPAPDIRRVRDGLKVIVFEQTAEALEKRLGFHVEEYGLRWAFRRIPNHPALAGLTAENLANWSGAATIVPESLKYEVDSRLGAVIDWCGLRVTRPFRAANFGNVASVLIEKPGRGDFLPIVDGGFSLQYSPLMEFHEGAGMILFCQLDVTGRSEIDPAAERLAQNAIDYVGQWKPAPARKAFYVGEEAGKAFFEKAGIPVAAYAGGDLPGNAVLIAGPGAGAQLKQDERAVFRFVAGGGHLIAIGLDQNDAASLPIKVGMKNAEFITTTFEPFPQGSPLAGVGPADLDNRDPRSLPLLASGVTIFGDGVLGKAPNANVVFCQLVPWQFDYAKQYNLKRTYRRASFAVLRLLANAGVAGETPLLERFASPAPAGKSDPRWLDGLYCDKPEEWDDPYRFFCW